MKTIDLKDLIPNGLIGKTTDLSDSIIPVITGQFYSYTTRLTREKPIFAAMHCKANKARALSELPKLGSIASLLFNFKDGSVEVSPLNEACNVNLPDYYAGLGNTSIALTELSHREFGAICSSRDRSGLFAATRFVATNTSVELTQEAVFAFKAEDGRSGLFIITEVSPSAVQIVACHTS